MDEIISTDIKTPYDRILIKIGEQEVFARPIEWDSEPIDKESNNKDNVPIVPIKYETTCPRCSQMMFIQAELKSAKCTECGYGENIPLLEPFISPFQDPGEYKEAIEEAPVLDVDLINLLGDD